MSTFQRYAIPEEHRTWDIPIAGGSCFTWEYEDGRDALLALYQKGKSSQWDANKRIDWDLEVDPYNALGLGDEMFGIYGTPIWDRLGPRDIAEMRRHWAAWQFSQFMHGEQGAMIVSARIVEAVPDLDGKFYASTQTVDEARHAETYSRFLSEKLDLAYPINPHLKALLDDILSDSRWDLPYLGMQVLIEGLALAAFGVLRDLTPCPLPKQILAYVMQDEARHVAFGRLTLRELYRELTAAERAEREEFVVEGCWLLRDRLRGSEVWETLGLPVADCDAATENSPYMRAFRTLLFSRIVPCVKDIGLWGAKVRDTYEKMGVLDLARANLSALMRADEEIADDLDARREQVAETIAAAR